jgi:hypothetical protein
VAQGYEQRKRLTFAQAEGVEPLPSQLKIGELSEQLRAVLWAAVHDSLLQSINRYNREIEDPWYDILIDKHVYRDYQAKDMFDGEASNAHSNVKQIFTTGSYIKVFDFIQWVLRHGNRPPGFADDIGEALKIGRAAYAIFDGDTIVPIASEAEAKNLRQAFVDLAATEFGGARAQLRNAGEKLTAGDFSGSVRDSIHAVEAVARLLEPSANTLDPALAKLKKKVAVHPALAQGFGKLYGYTSDQQGIRHALVDGPGAAVDESDALYMLGACAAFVSYLINKARNAGLISD